LYGKLEMSQNFNTFGEMSKIGEVTGKNLVWENFIANLTLTNVMN